MVAKAKLSGSLLARRNAFPTIGQGQSRAASPELAVDPSFAFPAENPISASLGKAGREGPSAALRAGVAVCGAVLAVMGGIAFLGHGPADIGEPRVALNSPTSTSRPPQDARISEATPASQGAAPTGGLVAPNIPPAAPPPPATAPAPKSPAVASDRQPASPAAAANVEPRVVTVAPAAPSPPAVAIPVPAASAAGSGGQPATSVATAPPHADPAAGAVAAAAEPSSTDAHPSQGARLSAQQSSALRTRGDALFGSGDIVGARLFYERAAEGGDGQAALRLGETYDPTFLKRAGIIGMRGDGPTAKRWYQVAYALGASEAQFLLESATDR